MAEQVSISPKKKAKRLSQFREAWTNEHPFIKKSRRGILYAFCEFCATDFSVSHGGYNDVTRHIGTDKHVGSAKAVAQSKSVSTFFTASNSQLSENIIKAELLFTGFLLEHNISIATSNHIGPLVKRMFPDSKIAEKYACAATKTTHIIQGAIAPDALSNVRGVIQGQKEYFGIALDASSDEFDKFFPVLITYAHQETGLIVTEFLDMVSCPSGRAQDLFHSVDTMLKKQNVDWNKCATYSADNAANMQGKHNSVLSRIRSVQSSDQKIYAVGCACHLVHLMAEHAAKALSVSVEDLIIDIYFHFQKSAKRVKTLHEYMAFCNTSVRKLVKHVKTRWLSLEKAVERTLFNWDALNSYFYSSFEEDSDSLGAREKRILASIKNPMTKVYLFFLHSVLPVFNTFNLLLQTEAPMVHHLYPAMLNLYRELLIRFVQPTVIATTGNILDIDYSDPSVQLSLEDIHIGFQTRNYARIENLIGTSSFQKFATETVAFFCTALNYMKKAMPLGEPILKSITFINPDMRMSSSIEDIHNVLNRFPKVIHVQDADRLLSEFRDYQSSDVPVIGSVRIDEFWHQLSQIKDPLTGQYRYGMLCKLVRFLLLIPHSNASCERLFSIVRKVITDHRSTLGKNPVTQQPGPNVYETVTTVRNTLCAILASKINIFSNSVCYKWQPSPQMLKKAKSATYVALSSRKESETLCQEDGASAGESSRDESRIAIDSIGTPTGRELTSVQQIEAGQASEQGICFPTKRLASLFTVQREKSSNAALKRKSTTVPTEGLQAPATKLPTSVPTTAQTTADYEDIVVLD